MRLQAGRTINNVQRWARGVTSIRAAKRALPAGEVATMVKNTDADEVPPALALLNMINGGWLSQAIAVAAKLKIADFLVDGPQTSAALAQATETHADSLHRLLRTLAGAGVLAEDEDGRFRLTPIGEPLRTGVPGSVHGFARMINEDYRTPAYAELLDAVKTG